MSKDAYIFTKCDHFTGGKQYMQERCPKCNGTGYYYDISFDNNGRAITVSGTYKLQQEVLKIVNDIKGNNMFFKRWGCELHNLIGQKSTKLTNAKLQMMIMMSLEYLQFLQDEENNTYKNMSASEMLLGIEHIGIVNYHVGYSVSVQIKNKETKILDQTILF